MPNLHVQVGRAASSCLPNRTSSRAGDTERSELFPAIYCRCLPLILLPYNRTLSKSSFASQFANMKLSSTLLSFVAAAAAHGDHDHDQEPLAGPHEGLWYNTLPGDGGTQVCHP